MILAFSLALVVGLAARSTPTPIPIALPTSFASPAPLATSTSPPGSALTTDQMQKIDGIALHALSDQGVTGMSLAVVRNGSVVYSRGYGYSSVELQQITRDASLYEVGAITKEFTAAAILGLADQAKLTLDDPLSKYVPDITRAKEITLRELLSMTSGIPSYTDLPDFDKNDQTAATPQQIVDEVKALPLDFDPGTKWEYSNTNYVLLGIVIEKVSSSDYGSYLDSQVLDKLSITVSRYGNVGASSPDLATGYQFDGRQFVPDPPWNLDWGYAADGLVSNVLDLAHWDTSLLRGDALSLPSLRTMWTSIALKDGTKIPWGYGWTIETLDGHREIDSNDELPGYAGRNATFPNDGFDVIVLANTNDFWPGPVVRQIFEMFYPPTPAQVTADQQGDAAAAVVARAMFLKLQAGRLQPADLTDFAQKRLTAKLLSQAKSALGALGAPMKFDLADSYLSGDETAYDYVISFKQAVLGFSISLDAQGRAGSLAVRPL